MCIKTPISLGSSRYGIFILERFQPRFTFCHAEIEQNHAITKSCAGTTGHINRYEIHSIIHYEMSSPFQDDSGKFLGFGFVNFQQTAAAANAVSTMNGMKIEGSHLYVAPAQKKKERQRQLQRE